MTTPNLRHLAWGAHAVVAVLPAGCVAAIGLLAWAVAGPDPSAVLARAWPSCEPVIAALDRYHRVHGRYPEDLSELAKEGLLVDVPQLPPHPGTSSRYGPYYQVSLPLDFYRLSLGYCVEGGLGPGDTYWAAYVSDDGRGWTRAASGDNMADLVAARLLATYRRLGDRRSLDLFMSEVIAKAGGNCLARDRVVGWLGEGQAIDLPPDVPGAVRKGSVYGARDDATRRYCLVYKDHWLPFLKSFLSPEERAKVPPDDGSPGSGSVDRNYPVLDCLFIIEEVGGQPRWSVISASPPSPRDKPSGRYWVSRE